MPPSLDFALNWSLELLINPLGAKNFEGTGSAVGESIGNLPR